ncbi:hypothetical protein, partial [Streptomyces kebangsaanensis]|uniref:hypothetical protein n=1 Tax=Streptomyces kebangsaanensis TaxID=864058 RepID=UPI001F4898C1
GVEAQRQRPCKGGATIRSVASREACGVVTQPSFRVERGSAEPFEIGVKAMEAVKILDGQP